MLRLEDVYTFLKVAEARGFTRAAYHLCISKSVVSERVARLERDVGAKLLARTSRGVSLTDAGMVFQQKSREILDQLEAVRETLPIDSSSLTGRLRVTMSIDYGLKCLTRPLIRFIGEHPDLHCYADYSDECADLDTGSYDLALRLGRASSVSSKVQIITHIHSIIVGSPGLVARVGAPAQPADLQDLPCLTYLGLTDVGIWHFEIENRRTPITVSGRFRANTMEALLIAAENGLGFAAMPYTFVADALDDGRLHHILPQHRVFDLVVGAHYPSGNRPTRNAEVLVRFLSQELAKQPCAPPASNG